MKTVTFENPNGQRTTMSGESWDELIERLSHRLGYLAEQISGLRALQVEAAERMKVVRMRQLMEKDL